MPKIDLPVHPPEGTVRGPNSATNDGVAVYDGSSGELIKNTEVQIVDNVVYAEGAVVGDLAASTPVFASASKRLTGAGVVPIANGGTGQSNAGSAINALLPSQAAHAGEFLTTDGSAASWGNPPGTLPAQPGHAGHILTSNGSAASWTGSLDKLQFGSALQANPAGSASIGWDPLGATDYRFKSIYTSGGGVFGNPNAISAPQIYFDYANLRGALIAGEGSNSFAMFGALETPTLGGVGPGVTGFLSLYDINASAYLGWYTDSNPWITFTSVTQAGSDSPFLKLNPAGEFLWVADGSGNVGNPSSGRPGNVYAKTVVEAGEEVNAGSTMSVRGQQINFIGPTTLSGTYYTSVFVDGDATLGSGVSVQGDLTVLGDFTGGVNSLEVLSDFSPCGNVTFTGSGNICQIRGNLFLTPGTTFSGIGDTDTPGLDVTVGGNATCSATAFINLSGGDSSGSASAAKGGTLTIGGIVQGIGITSTGGIGTGSEDAGNGGDVNLLGGAPFAVNINVSGGAADVGKNGGPGNIYAVNVLTDGLVMADGGGAGDPADNSASLQCYGYCLFSGFAVSSRSDVHVYGYAGTIITIESLSSDPNSNRDKLTNGDNSETISIASNLNNPFKTDPSSNWYQLDVSAIGANPGYSGDDEIIMYLSSSNGSTNTTFAKFGSVLHTAGSAISQTTTDAAGTIFTINETGQYAVIFSTVTNATNKAFGILKNWSGSDNIQPNIYNIPPTRLMALENGTADAKSADAVFRCEPGDTIVCAIGAGFNGDGGPYCFVRVTKVT